jgi:Phosphodiester glycosidase
MRSARRVIAAVTAAALCSLLASGGAAAPAGAARHPHHHRTHFVKTTRVAPGLKLTRIVDTRIPRRTFVLRANLAKAITFDVELAGASFPMRQRTSRIAKSAGAIAAVNGDFGSFSSTVTHPYADDGELVRSAGRFGWLFSVSADERRTFMDRVLPQIEITDRATGRTFPVELWNDAAPPPGEIAAFTSVGGSKYPPPRDACSVRLLPAGPPGFAPHDGIDQSFTVDQVGCQSSPMATGDGVVLSAPPSTDEATELLSLSVGGAVLLHWSFGWADVLDAIGGLPPLISDGRIVVDRSCGSAFCGANPRTGIGATARGRLLFVVVDGRQPRWSSGVTLYRFAQIMKGLGAVAALNLDGGGSSTMVVKGSVVNRPSEGFQRKVSSAAVILPGPDPNETR